jgi:hypothetical protein
LRDVGFPSSAGNSLFWQAELIDLDRSPIRSLNGLLTKLTPQSPPRRLPRTMPKVISEP